MLVSWRQRLLVLWLGVGALLALASQVLALNEGRAADAADLITLNTGLAAGAGLIWLLLDLPLGGFDLLRTWALRRTTPRWLRALLLVVLGAWLELALVLAAVGLTLLGLPLGLPAAPPLLWLLVLTAGLLAGHLTALATLAVRRPHWAHGQVSHVGIGEQGSEIRDR